MFVSEKTMHKMLAKALGVSTFPKLDELLEEVKALVTTRNSPVRLKKEITSLKEEIAVLKLEKKKEIEELKLTRDIEERDIKHLIKIKEERLSLESKKTEVDLKDKFKDKEMSLQKEYFDKSITQLETARNEMKEVYTEIMKRLPNVNMNIGKSIDDES